MLTPIQFRLENTAAPFDRRLYSVAVTSLEQISVVQNLTEDQFVLFLAMDAREVPDEVIKRLATLLLEEGLAYLCAWGPDCERVHDLFDLAEAELELDVPSDSVVMTTWHADEPLEEALWFFVNCAFPDELYAETRTAGVAVTVSNPDWAATVSRWLQDLDGLKRVVVDAEPEPAT